MEEEVDDEEVGGEVEEEEERRVVGVDVALLLSRLLWGFGVCFLMGGLVDPLSGLYCCCQRCQRGCGDSGEVVSIGGREWEGEAGVQSVREQGSSPSSSHRSCLSYSRWEEGGGVGGGERMCILRDKETPRRCLNPLSHHPPSTRPPTDQPINHRQVSQSLDMINCFC